jgi:hypothetical protein
MELLFMVGVLSTASKVIPFFSLTYERPDLHDFRIAVKEIICDAEACWVGGYTDEDEKDVDASSKQA